MPPTKPRPWHEIMDLRDDVRSGELSLASFAASLHAAIMGTEKTPYSDPREFFALTYPTLKLRELAKDVALRLDGRSGKAVRQLELTYGGGKTHTLIALYHLVNDPENLPEELPAVREFLSTIDFRPPRTRVGFVPFDRLDAEKGMEARAPNGTLRSFRMPWSVLAWQLGGEKGLAALGGEGERELPPMTNVIEAIFKIPLDEGFAVLILLDEILMWARIMAGVDTKWIDRIEAFFQSLSQALASTPRTAMIASLLASDLTYSDKLGKEVARRIGDVLAREQEERVQPVQRADVAEVLRRRLFKPDSYANIETFRPHVAAAVSGVAALDDETAKTRRDAEKALLASYPFDPYITEVFYDKWTQLSSFQRTRGVLRVYALALRDAAKWDKAPLIGPSVFLAAPDVHDLSPAASELALISRVSNADGPQQDWKTILEGELAKARKEQQEFSLLKRRELEQAVIATYLHSQPIGQEATLRDLYRVLGPCHPDRMNLNQALRRWAEVSWFLDEKSIADRASATDVPVTWRLGVEPNLTQMHQQSIERARGGVEARLTVELGKVKSLLEGLSGLGVKVHKFPAGPADITDDAEFHYAVLTADAASDTDKPSALARRYFTETTTADRVRTNKNLLVLAVPSRDGLEVAREAILAHLAWKEVELQLAGQPVDPVRSAKLTAEVQGSHGVLTDRVRQAWCLGVTLDAKGQVAAHKVTPTPSGLFAIFMADERMRIQEGAVACDALLPGGPYDVWKGDVTRRYAKDIVEAFSQWPEMPKILRPKAVYDTLAMGCREGLVVIRASRPDESARTWWRESPDTAALADRGVEIVLPEKAELSGLPSELLVPGKLPKLWQGESLAVTSLATYFSGDTVVRVERQGIEEPLAVPSMLPAVLTRVVWDAVKVGHVWFLSGSTSLWKEDVPAGISLDGGVLRATPAAIAPEALLPEAVPAAWEDRHVTAASLSDALSASAGLPLPWPNVAEAIAAAIVARKLEVVSGRGSWPCGWDSAAHAIFKERTFVEGPPPVDPPPVDPPRPTTRSGTATLSPAQVALLADAASGIAAVTGDATFMVRLDLPADASDDTVKKVNVALETAGVPLKVN